MTGALPGWGPAPDLPGWGTPAPDLAGKGGVPLPDTSRARTALASARRERAETIARVALGELDVHDVIEAATRPGNKALLALRLEKILGAQPEWGHRRVKAFFAHIDAIVEAPPPTKGHQISWLLDRRSGGRRFLAWADAWHDRDRPPWPGFPHAPWPGPDQTGPGTDRAGS